MADLPRLPRGMFVDPAQLPTTLMEPSMQAGQSTVAETPMVALGDSHPCWAWWRTSDKPGHHRCSLRGDHDGLCECCCGARTADAEAT